LLPSLSNPYKKDSERIQKRSCVERRKKRWESAVVGDDQYHALNNEKVGLMRPIVLQQRAMIEPRCMTVRHLRWEYGVDILLGKLPLKA
jgi:hypothetical protein